jgi:hypothetical protein
MRRDPGRIVRSEGPSIGDGSPIDWYHFSGWPKPTEPDMRTSTLLLSLLLVFAVPAIADEATRIHGGDRAVGLLDAPGEEAGFAFHAVTDTEVKITVKATSGDLEPELLLIDPDDFRVDMGGSYRHTQGSSKAKLKGFAMPSSGCYTIVVRGIAGTTGAYKLKIKAEHEVKYRSEGRVEFFGDSDLMRFSALEGSMLTFKVKGRSGFQPFVQNVLQPDTNEVFVPGVEFAGTKVKGSEYRCPETGDYRLRVETSLGFSGEWKGKIKLVPTENAKRELTVDGEDEGTYTDDMKEPGSPPLLPVRDIVTTVEFRLTLSILDPKEDLTWIGGQSMSLMVTLQNLSPDPQGLTVGFYENPWNNIIVRNVQTSQIVWRLNAVTLPFANQESFPWADVRTWSKTWPTSNQAGSPLPAGEYDIVATFGTFDSRMPQEARIRIQIE